MPFDVAEKIVKESSGVGKEIRNLDKVIVNSWFNFWYCPIPFIYNLFIYFRIKYKISITMEKSFMSMQVYIQIQILVLQSKGHKALYCNYTLLIIVLNVCLKCNYFSDSE